MSTNTALAVGKQNAQIEEMKAEIVKRVQGTALAFPEPVIMKMLGLGVNPNDLPVVQALCLVNNIPVANMQYRQNVAEISRLAQMVSKLGYRRGEDYDIVTREANQDEYNEDGTPKMNGKYQARTKQPTISIQITAARQVENAKADGKANGVQHVFFTDIVEDAEKAQAIFRSSGLDERIWHKDVVVARCVVKTVHPAVGLLGEQSSYGFYLPVKLEEKWDDGLSKYVQTGKVVANGNETGKQKDNYHPSNIAKKRAMTSAARQITRTLYARNDVPVANNVAAIIGEAGVRLTEIQQSASDLGVTIDQYIDHGEELEAQAEQGRKILDEQVAINTIALESEKKADEKTTVTSSTSSSASSPAVEGASSRPVTTSADAVTVDSHVNVDTSHISLDVDEAPVYEMSKDEWENVIMAADNSVTAMIDLARKECPELLAWSVEVSAISMTAQREPNVPMLLHLLSVIENECEASELEAQIILRFLSGTSMSHEIKQEVVTFLFKDLVKKYDFGKGVQENSKYSEEKMLMVKVAHGLLKEVQR